jgi:hypothetical protein
MKEPCRNVGLFLFTFDFMAIGKSKLHELLKRAKQLDEGKMWLKAMNQPTQEMILQMIKIDQLQKRGVDATGEVIGYYSLVTSLINPKKKFNTHYTLEDSGYFYFSMYVKVLMEEIQINADGQKDEENIIEKYGSKILNLTDENLQKLIERTKKAYIRELKRVLLPR